MPLHPEGILTSGPLSSWWAGEAAYGPDPVEWQVLRLKRVLRTEYWDAPWRQPMQRLASQLDYMAATFTSDFFASCPTKAQETWIAAAGEEARPRVHDGARHAAARRGPAVRAGLRRGTTGPMGNVGALPLLIGIDRWASTTSTTRSRRASRGASTRNTRCANWKSCPPSRRRWRPWHSAPSRRAASPPPCSRTRPARHRTLWPSMPTWVRPTCGPTTAPERRSPVRAARRGCRGSLGSRGVSVIAQVSSPVSRIPGPAPAAVPLPGVAGQGGRPLELRPGLRPSAPAAPAGRRGRSAAGGSRAAPVRRPGRRPAPAPAAGPSAIETATARFSSTTGDGVSAASRPYSGGDRRPVGVLVARPPGRGRRRSRPGGRTGRLARDRVPGPRCRGGSAAGSSGPGSGRRAAPARRRGRCGPAMREAWNSSSAASPCTSGSSGISPASTRASRSASSQRAGRTRSSPAVAE